MGKVYKIKDFQRFMKEQNRDPRPYERPLVSIDTCKALRSWIQAQYQRGISKDDLLQDLIRGSGDRLIPVLNFKEDMARDYAEDNPELGGDYHDGYAEGIYDGILLFYALVKKQHESDRLNNELRL